MSEYEKNWILRDLADAQPLANQIFQYNGVRIIPVTPNLNFLTDVVISSPSDDQFLRYNGTNWVNETVTFFSPDFVIAEPWMNTLNGATGRYGGGMTFDNSGVSGTFTAGEGKSSSLTASTSIQTLLLTNTLYLSFWFQMVTEPTRAAGASGTAVFGIGAANFGYGGAGAITSEIINHIAILFKYTFSGAGTDVTRTIQASCANGTTQSTATITGITPTNAILYTIKITPTAITFYADGVQVASLTTNIPTSIDGNKFIQIGGSTDGNQNNVPAIDSSFWSLVGQITT